MLKFIQKPICLDPQHLDQNLKLSLLIKAKEVWVGKCTKEDGYILEVVDIAEILDNFISPATTSILFKLKLVAKVLKPEIKKCFTTTVNMVLQQGIFTICENILNILVPINQIIGYEFDGSKGVYLSKNNPENVISIKTQVQVEITAIRYEKNKFTCIGKLKVMN